jgi:hypothetical protein
MSTANLRFCIVAVVCAACAACASEHGSQLDGPVDYGIDDGFIHTRTTVHLELDGSATKLVTVGTGPTRRTTATIAASQIAQLRSDIAAVDLASLRDDYSCADHVCTTDQPVVMIDIAADGARTQIRVDRGIDDRDLPVALVAIMADLDAITRQIP